METWSRLWSGSTAFCFLYIELSVYNIICHGNGNQNFCLMLYIVIMIIIEKASMQIKMLVNMLTNSYSNVRNHLSEWRNGISQILHGPPTVPLPAKRSVVPPSAISLNLNLRTWQVCTCYVGKACILFKPVTLTWAENNFAFPPQGEGGGYGSFQEWPHREASV